MRIEFGLFFSIFRALLGHKWPLKQLQMCIILELDLFIRITIQNFIHNQDILHKLQQIIQDILHSLHQIIQDILRNLHQFTQDILHNLLQI